MGLNSTLIYTSELILCFTIRVKLSLITKKKTQDIYLEAITLHGVSVSFVVFIAFDTAFRTSVCTHELNSPFFHFNLISNDRFCFFTDH